jgi:hypothetical protein
MYDIIYYIAVSYVTLPWFALSIVATVVTCQVGRQIESSIEIEIARTGDKTTSVPRTHFLLGYWLAKWAMMLLIMD